MSRTSTFQDGSSGAARLRWSLRLGVPALALVVYAAVGEPGRWAHALRSDAVPAFGSRPLPSGLPLDQEQDVDRLRARARAAEAEGEFAQAVAAHRRLAALRPRDATVLGDLAVALAMVPGHAADPEPEALLRQALQIEPGNVQILALLGGMRFEHKDYAGAASAWEDLLGRVDANSPVGASIRQNIDRARSLAR